jgi:hypothetical protein
LPDRITIKSVPVCSASCLARTAARLIAVNDPLKSALASYLLEKNFPAEMANDPDRPDVLPAFRATGAGWQTRMNDALRDWLRTHSPV